MSAGKFQRFISRVVVPWWMQNRYTSTALESIGLVLDIALQTLIEGLFASMPLECEEDALPYIATDRGLRLYPTEPVDSKRHRLAQWWQLHRGRATHLGEMRHLQPYFLPGKLPRIRIVHQAGDGSCATWHTLESDGTYSIHRATPSNWNWDGKTAQWSRVFVIIYMNGTDLALDPAKYNDGSMYDQAGLYWDGIPGTARDDIVQALRDWEGPHYKLWSVILTTDDDSFDPTADAVTDPSGWTSLPVGNWGFVIDNTAGNLTRPPYAHFIYDLGQG